MDSIISSLQRLFSAYGFRAATIVLVTVVLVNLLKKPLVKAAKKLSVERGIDKSVITRHATFLPFAVAVLVTALWSLIEVGFAFSEIEWTGLVSAGMTYGALAVATYETVKKQLQAYAAKKYAPQLLTQAAANCLPEEKEGEQKEISPDIDGK